MKQVFLALVGLNICFLLFQQFSGAEESEAQAGPEPQAVEQKSEPFGAAAVTASRVAKAGRVVAPENDNIIAKKPPDAGEVVAKSAATETDSVAEVATTEAADALPPSNCVLAGPFRGRSQAEAVVRQLTAAKVEAALQPRDGKLLPDYMVYIGPQASLTEARELDATFKGQDRESQIIANGSLQNALSLGVYSRRPLALELQEELVDLGYEPKIATINRNRRGFQVLTEMDEALRARFTAADTPFIDCPQAIAQR